MNDVLELQNNLQNESRDLLASTPLLDILGKLGDVIQTGSSVTGLMAYPDIDFTIQNENPDIQNAIDLTQYIFSQLQATGLKIADFRDTSSESASYYVGLELEFNSKQWHIDVTVGKPGPIVTNPPELTSWLEAMTDEQRITILELKKELIEARRYVGSKSQPPYTFRSAHLYEAVLRGETSTIPAIEAYFKEI
jgi:hypothetical protein